MDTYGVDLMGRRLSAKFKASVIAQCLKPGVSIAAVALALDLNANMLRKWVMGDEHQLARSAPSVVATAGGIPRSRQGLLGFTYGGYW